MTTVNTELMLIRKHAEALPVVYSIFYNTNFSLMNLNESF